MTRFACISLLPAVFTVSLLADPLPSRNETKTTVIDFVEAVSTVGSKDWSIVFAQ